METILLAIKPEYVERIFSGIKHYEFRKRLPRKDIEKIIVYATHPIMKVIGEVEVVDYIFGSPTAVWEQTKKNAGISREKYREYFKDCKTAYAFHLGKTKIYDEPKVLNDFGITTAPQSFVYIEEKQVK